MRSGRVCGALRSTVVLGVLAGLVAGCSGGGSSEQVETRLTDTTFSASDDFPVWVP